MSKLDHVEARLAIYDVMAHYVHALDDRDYDALDSVFTPDAMFDLTTAGGIRDSWPVVKRWFASNLHVFVDYFHLIGNIRISFDDGGETARTRSKVINPCGLKGEDGRVHHFETIGSYDDVWVCTPDGWRISERTWNHGWIWGDYPRDDLPGQF
jgi:3-phenylpropionate/cinnamic acid dioxygenase small subunit